MVYLPAFKNQPNVGKYTIHGSGGYFSTMIVRRQREEK